MSDKTKTPTDESAIRQLMVAVEYMRYACEHSEGKTTTDCARLIKAMSVGIRINAKLAHMVPDYHRDSFWDDVWDTNNTLTP
jgi:hypothetical protein